MSREHGTYVRYTLGEAGERPCRCAQCREAKRVYEANRVRQIAYGRWTPFVDAEPVREHVRGLMALGMGWKQVAADAGLSSSVVYSLLYRKREQPVTKVRAKTAQALLSVRLRLAGGALVDSTGTVRRVRALVAYGYPLAVLARGLGMTPTNLSRLVKQPVCLVSTKVLVAALYADLENTPGPSNRARNMGARESWPLPMAWDDDTIDDPAASPAVTHRTRTSNRCEDVAEDVEWLIEAGATWASACGRLEMRSDALERALYRAGRGDLVARLRRTA